MSAVVTRRSDTNEEGENEMNDRQEVFTYFMACGPGVKMSLGTVLHGQVSPDYVVVHAAPPRLVREIVTTFKSVGLTEGLGLLIPITSLPDSFTTKN